MKVKPELTVAYWTLSGRFPGIEPEYSRFEFQERVEAASKAGFVGLGFWHADLDHILKRRSLKEMRQILRDNGIKYVDVEFLTDWFVAGERKKQSDAHKRKLLTAAEGLGATQIKVGDFYSEQCPMPHLIASFAALCKEASEVGTRVAFEPMAVSMVHTLDESLEMVRGSGAKNAGIILDIWHMMNLDIPREEIARLPAQYVAGAEVNDGVFTQEAGLRKPIVDRRFCGDGEFNITGFIRAVQQTGYSGPWGIEIFSHDLLEAPLERITQRAFESTVWQFAKES
jgi:sugar phosphate isomerase/epimerase